jgi:hypothetical protein
MEYQGDMNCLLLDLEREFRNSVLGWVWRRVNHEEVDRDMLDAAWNYALVRAWRCVQSRGYVSFTAVGWPLHVWVHQAVKQECRDRRRRRVRDASWREAYLEDHPDPRRCRRACRNDLWEVVELLRREPAGWVRLWLNKVEEHWEEGLSGQEYGEFFAGSGRDSVQRFYGLSCKVRKKLLEAAELADVKRVAEEIMEGVYYTGAPSSGRNRDGGTTPA